MSKSRKPPGSRSDVLLNELLAAIGKGDLNPFQRYPLIAALEKIWSAYAERPGELTAEGTDGSGSFAQTLRSDARSEKALTLMKSS